MLPLADTQFVEATWIMIVKSIVIFAVIFGILPVLTVVERKLIGRFQHRYGPNRVGPYGLLQPLADVGKLISKESFRPANAIPTLFILGPLLPVLAGVLSLATTPGEPGQTCVLLVDARHDASAPLARRCTYGIVWIASATKNREANALAVAVQPMEAWRELWVFRKAKDGWIVSVLPPATTAPGIGFAEFAGNVA